MRSAVHASNRAGSDDVPTVLLVMPGMGMGGRLDTHLFQMAARYRWKLIDNTPRGEMWPSGLRPDGAIVCRPEGEYIDKLVKVGCPTVRIGMAEHPNDAVIPAVVPDLHAAGDMAAVHFCERGFRNVCFVGFANIEKNPMAGLLYNGCRARMAELGGQCDLYCFESVGMPESGSPAARYRRRLSMFTDWVPEMPKPLGLFTMGDSLAKSLCCMCEDVGITVPDQVAILGLGNHEFACSCSTPPLSSIALDNKLQAEVAVDLLARKMNGEPHDASTIWIPPLGVAARESTETVGTRDPRVSAAVIFMWKHLHCDLCVDDVARKVGVARRTLEYAFRKHLGRGVIAELRRRRLEVFRELLISSDAPIAELAAQVGFRTLVHLRRSFRQVYGMSPREFRAQHR